MLIPDRFKSDVLSVSARLSEQFSAVQSLSTEFFTASEHACLLVHNTEKLTPIIAGGFNCVRKQGGVLGPAAAIESAQQSIKVDYACRFGC